MSFAQVAEPAIDLAEHGFAVHSVMHETLSGAGALKAMRSWPSTRSVFLDEAGAPPPIGTPIVQRDLARTLRHLAAAEAGAANREAGIRAVRARFYQGDIAEAIDRFMRPEGGWIRLADLAEFHVVDHRTGVRHGGADPRRVAYAIGR